ncbi:MAG: ComEC/Rec2 family competence protein, partial [Cyanobacteria bacterium NC_groundwater_1444_Ag_S-0.65um_54_12]|nr:ComEC/Rec2 family competence protein [Cyanobacteria bacterium NC_groundwater_1444_Ag_S-0.65um_54_12]
MNLISFTIGWAAGCAVPAASWGVWLSLLLLGLALIHPLLRPRNASRISPNREIGNHLTWILLFSAVPLGSAWQQSRIPRPAPEDLSRLAPWRQIQLQVRVISDPVAVRGAWHYQARAELGVFPQPRRLAGKLAVIQEADNASGPNEPATANATVPKRPRYGDLLLLTGRLRQVAGPRNPGEPDLAARWSKQGIFCRLHALRWQKLASSTSKFDPLLIASVLKERAVTVLGTGLAEQERALIGSLIFGAAAVPVARETRELFADLGLAHALAASGMQITLLLQLVLVAGRACKLQLSVRLILAGSAILLFAAMAGFEPAILRATVMGLANLVAEASGRMLMGIRALFLASLALLLLQPSWISDLGFQFSFLATWGLLTTSKLLETMLRRLGFYCLGVSLDFWNSRLFRWSSYLGNHLLQLLVCPLAALIWCTPLQLTVFGQLSLWSLPANWFASNLITLLTYLGFLLAGSGMIFPPVGAASRLLLTPFLAVLQFGLQWLHQLPGASYHIPPLPPWSAIAAYGGLCAILPVIARKFPPLVTSVKDQRQLIERDVTPKKLTNHDYLRLFVAGMALVIPVIDQLWSRQAAGVLQLLFLDVGQGDAILLRTPHGHCVLVDAGPRNEYWDAGSAVVLPALQRSGCTHLALAVLTHPHADHLGGLLSVMEKIPTSRVWDAGQPYPSALYRQFLASLLLTGTPFARAWQGSSTEIDGVR